MEWLNYHHLLYFWTVVRTGGIGPAARELMLSPPTVSAQIRALEQSVGRKLFRRQGRALVLTEAGHLVNRYAGEIFPLGQELLKALREESTGRPLEFAVGLTGAVPKTIAKQILEPALSLDPPVQLSCHEGTSDQLLAALGQFRLDMILADEMVHDGGVKAFNHLLGRCGITWTAASSLASRLGRQFPDLLRDAPLLLPSEQTALRRSIDKWFLSIGIEPKIAGEFDDSALMKVFGSDGHGVVPIHRVIAPEVHRRYGLEPLGSVDEPTEQFYAISGERRLKHPAVVAITQAARATLFGRD
jgi:LysR family transcriptional regulator, transcriptional activator of nhaA